MDASVVLLTPRIVDYKGQEPDIPRNVFLVWECYESCLACGRPGYEHSCPAQNPIWRRRTDLHSRVTPIETRLATLLCLARIRGRRSRRQPLFNHTSLGGGFQNDRFQTIILTILTMISDHRAPRAEVDHKLRVDAEE